MGWQNKQFLGRGEFTLEFGDYDVKITVPSDHIVAATGELQNPKEVLTKTQRKRLSEAKKAKKPVLIVTIDEALENEKSRSTKNKTWHFKAKNVRDFAFASSRKFIWDAQGYQHGGSNTMAMSFYLMKVIHYGKNTQLKPSFIPWSNTANTLLTIRTQSLFQLMAL